MAERDPPRLGAGHPSRIVLARLSALRSGPNLCTDHPDFALPPTPPWLPARWPQRLSDRNPDRAAGRICFCLWHRMLADLPALLAAPGPMDGSAVLDGDSAVDRG